MSVKRRGRDRGVTWWCSGKEPSRVIPLWEIVYYIISDHGRSFKTVGQLHLNKLNPQPRLRIQPFLNYQNNMQDKLLIRRAFGRNYARYRQQGRHSCAWPLLGAERRNRQEPVETYTTPPFSSEAPQDDFHNRAELTFQAASMFQECPFRQPAASHLPGSNRGDWTASAATRPYQLPANRNRPNSFAWRTDATPAR